MAVPAGPTINFTNIVNEFGGTAPHSISEYYRGGPLVPNVPANSAIPTSGQISLSNFYNAQTLFLLQPQVVLLQHLEISKFIHSQVQELLQLHKQETQQVQQLLTI
jgi:hypothetical protein